MSLFSKLRIFDPDIGDVVLDADQLAAIQNAEAEAETFGDIITGKVTASGSINAAAPATERLVYGKLSVAYQGVVAIAGGGSLAGVRGEVAGASGVTLGDGFYYGAQGKFTLGGATIVETSAARYCGVIAQLDVSAGVMTSGQLSALWADMGGSAAAAFPAETNVIRAQNTTAQAVNAILYGYGKAAYGFDLSDNGGGWLSLTGSAGTTSAKGWIKVHINGSNRFIPLSDTGS